MGQDLTVDVVRTASGTSQHWDDPGAPDEFAIKDASIRFDARTLFVPSEFFPLILNAFPDEIADAAQSAHEDPDHARDRLMEYA